MDISSKKLPIILIVALTGILILQVATNDSGRLVDPQTCEIHVRDSQVGGKRYTGEYDQKCLDFKDVSP